MFRFIENKLICLVVMLLGVSMNFYGQKKDCMCDIPNLRLNIHNPNLEIGGRVGVKNLFGSWYEDRRKTQLSLGPSVGFFLNHILPGDMFSLGTKIEYSLFSNKYKTADPPSAAFSGFSDVLASLQTKTNLFDFKIGGTFYYKIKQFTPFLEAGTGIGISQSYSFFAKNENKLKINDVLRFFDVAQTGVIAPVVYANLGCKYRVKDEFVVGLEIDYTYYFSDKIDGLKQIDTNRSDFAAGVYLSLIYSY